jgi:hypothetical protein
MRIFLLGSGAAILALSGAAQAQAPAAVNSVVNCRNESREQERLRCYDAAAAALSQALANRSIIVVDQETVRNTRKSLFGFDVGKLPFFGGGKDSEPEAKEVVARLKSARPTGFRQWLLELDTGAVWETTEATNSPLPKAGSEITIRKSPTGAYMLRDGAGLIRARRVR